MITLKPQTNETFTVMTNSSLTNHV